MRTRDGSLNSRCVWLWVVVETKKCVLAVRWVQGGQNARIYLLSRICVCHNAHTDTPGTEIGFVKV